MKPEHYFSIYSMPTFADGTEICAKCGLPIVKSYGMTVGIVDSCHSEFSEGVTKYWHNPCFKVGIEALGLKHEKKVVENAKTNEK